MTSQTAAIRKVLVIDDDEGVRQFLKRGLSYEGYEVSLAESGEVGLRAMLGAPPHLVILDVMMPGLDGFEVLRRLRGADPDLPVLMLTGKDEPEAQALGLESGADDYVLKPVNFDVLLARLRALERRIGGLPASVLRYDDLVMDVQRFTVQRDQREVQLSATQFKLLRAFLEQPERVLNKQVLLDQVWGKDFFGDENVVEVYVKQLRERLEESGEARLIQTIRNVGYVLRTS